MGKSSVSRQHRALSEALLGRKSHANPRGVRLSTVLWQNRMNHSATALLLRSGDFKASYLLCHEFYISKASDFGWPMKYEFEVVIEISSFCGKHLYCLLLYGGKYLKNI